MTLEELRLLVQETEHLSGETQVYMAQQPHYPLQTTISRYEVVGCDDARINELVEALDEVEDGEQTLAVEERKAAKLELDNLQRDGNQSSIIYLAEGSQVYDEPYLPGHVCTALGWR